MLPSIAVLFAILLIPGWFVLAFTGLWRRWPGLQAWLLALGIGIALYPVGFYAARVVMPFLPLGPVKLAAILVVLLTLTAWRLRTDWRKLFAFAALEWVALGVFAATLLTRVAVAWNHPFPAWTDALHHTLLTHLTATQGRLPTTLAPYFPIPLDQYHLGLYALSAAVQWLAQVPAYTALLASGQVLNALAAIGVYLVLDRKVSRVAAIAGAVLVGLLSQQPAIYVNWGRTTQLAGQIPLLIGWLVVWESLEAWAKPIDPATAHRPWHRRPQVRARLAGAGVAALLTAGIFLLHFRVAAFYLPLLGLTTITVLGRARRDGAQVRRVLLGTLTIGALSLLLIFPVLLDALRVYIAERVQASVTLATQGPRPISPFYQFPLDVFPYLVGLPWWAMGLSVAAALLAALRRNGIAVTALLWTGLVLALGYTYVLRVPLLNVTNLGAVLIMLYMPIGLMVGAGLEEARRLLPLSMHRRAAGIILVMALASGALLARERTGVLEEYRYFMTHADAVAMQWIRANTAQDALFAVNTDFWLPDAPHGADGGYWIPYFAGRATSAGVMINNLGAADYRAAIVARSAAVLQAAADPPEIAALQQEGIDYIYVGAKPHFAGNGLDPERLTAHPALTEVYAAEGVHIFRVEAAGR